LISINLTGHHLELGQQSSSACPIPMLWTLLELLNLLLSACHIIATIMSGFGAQVMIVVDVNHARELVQERAHRYRDHRIKSPGSGPKKMIILSFTSLCEKGIELNPIETAGWLNQAPQRSLRVLTGGKTVLLSSIDYMLMITSRPEDFPVKTPGEVPYNEKRKGSVFADLSRRKESVAALTENVTGEWVHLYQLLVVAKNL
jgi:hypothetical protein